MIELKGIDRLNKVVNDFTAQFGVTAELGPEFQAFCDNNHINFAINYDEEDGQYFLADVEKRYPEIEADIFIWCLLHEIGHCRTEHLWSAEEAEYFEYQKEQLACNIEDDQLRNDWYHAVPDEFFATKWAGDYMMEHIEEVAKFYYDFEEALNMFYAENCVIGVA